MKNTLRETLLSTLPPSPPAPHPLVTAPPFAPTPTTRMIELPRGEALSIDCSIRHRDPQSILRDYICRGIAMRSSRLGCEREDRCPGFV